MNEWSFVYITCLVAHLSGILPTVITKKPITFLSFFQTANNRLLLKLDLLNSLTMTYCYQQKTRLRIKYLPSYTSQG